jgi:hypothetical protein
MTQPVWNTTSGLIDTYPYGISMSYQLSASPVLPATFLSYKLLSGSLPTGLSLNSSGLISGIPGEVSDETDYTFVVRATDNFNNVRDRTFIIRISGYITPSFTIPAGLIFSGFDSRWIELSIPYSNPSNISNLQISLAEGSIPSGLEINSEGIIRGYATKPIIESDHTQIKVIATLTNLSNEIICTNTDGFEIGRPVIFSGLVFGSLIPDNVYYIREIKNTTTFTISSSQNGPEITLSAGSGLMNITLPAVSVGYPVLRTFDFVLNLTNGSFIYQTIKYSINIGNQELPAGNGGLGIGPNARVPTILNTRPFSFVIPKNNIYYGYYILPESGLTYPPSSNVQLATIKSGDYFSFKFIGHDFDGNDLTYAFINLPPNLTGDTTTGWITGTPTLSSSGISFYTFTVAVYKTNNSSVISSFFNFIFKVYNEVIGDIDWITDENLGQINNNTISTLKVEALSDIQLNYEIVSGSLPPNLVLTENGEIIGKVAFQPLSTELSQGTSTEFTFTVNAFSPLIPSISSSKTFKLTVYQYFQQPIDILYIKATPSLSDRQKINTLLTDNTLIPSDFIYRPDDLYFGKSSSVIYQHAYGIHSSTITQYLEAIEKNHYWRNITLGEIKTAVARNQNNEIIYEVVYSEIIDNLVNNQNISVSEQIVWPRDIDLQLGPWYTSITDIYTSYETLLSQSYYTSLTSGEARILYPNSLQNMRTRVGQELGLTDDSNVLPLWMTSQQQDGNTLGFVKAWVICYTKPGFADRVKTNINTNWQYKLNQINFEIDRFIVNKSATYNYNSDIIFKAFPNPYDTNFTINGTNNNQLQPVGINPFVTVTLTDGSIWNVTQLNNSWSSLPSATPVPNPIDSEDFYVIFEQKTILPNRSQ